MQNCIGHGAKTRFRCALHFPYCPHPHRWRGFPLSRARERGPGGEGQLANGQVHRRRAKPCLTTIAKCKTLERQAEAQCDPAGALPGSSTDLPVAYRRSAHHRRSEPSGFAFNAASLAVFAFCILHFAFCIPRSTGSVAARRRRGGRRQVRARARPPGGPCRSRSRSPSQSRRCA